MRCLPIFLASLLVRTDSRGPLWSKGRGARQASVVTHLFISLFITSAANIFTIMLFCGLFSKCVVRQVRFRCALSWKRIAWGSPARGEGKAGQQSQKHYIIDLSVNGPFSGLRLPKADGETELSKHRRPVCSSVNRPCHLRSECKGASLGTWGG